MAANEGIGRQNSERGYTSASNRFQAIDAHYFNITDADSWPIAGLLVLLDGRRQAVRAELHVDDGVTDPVQEAAVRQARLVLQERYWGAEPLPLRVLAGRQSGEPIKIHLPSSELQGRTGFDLLHGWRPAAIGSVAVVIVLIWIGLAVFVRQGGRRSEVAAVAGKPAVSSSMAMGAPAATDASHQVVRAETGATADVSAGAAQAGAPAVNLPPSQFANKELGIGVKVQIVKGLKLSLRSEAGPNAGQIVGYLASGQQATVIDGPVTTQGDADTIVWWYVRLNDGTEAWAAANTSHQTLLVPVQ